MSYFLMNLNNRKNNLNKTQKQQYTICALVLLIVIIMIMVILIGILFLGDNRDVGNISSETENSTETLSSELLETETESDTETEMDEVLPPDESSIVVDTEDPQEQGNGNMTHQSGADSNFEDVIDDANKNINENEIQEITFGIDVSKYQGTIDWKQVAESGVDFVMVRVGYRTLKTGEIVADPNAKYNMQEAQKYGIKVGAYFFSTAVTEAEAIEEADWVANYISGYRITYPVAYNCEGFEDSENRQYGLTKSQRTNIAIAFLSRIGENGYSPMFYASKSDMENSAKWNMSQIDSSYKVWVAQYPSVPYPETKKSSYLGAHDMWQYTNQGTVPGIKKPVDVNVAYFGFQKEEGPKGEQESEEVEANVEALMNFRESGMKNTKNT